MRKKSLFSRVLCLILVMGLIFCQGSALAQNSPPAPTIDPALVRAAAAASGLDALGNVPVPVPDLIALGVVVDGKALVQLGKALFWDQQVGSDGQACASCHFAAGADNRAKNQLNPDLRNVNPDPVFGNVGDIDPNLPRFAKTEDHPATAGHPAFGPNYTLLETDFPFHTLQDPEENNFDLRVVERDTNDVTSSQGVFKAQFLRVVPLFLRDLGLPVPDDIFNVGGINVRRVEPRNTPTNINAVFNLANFWDGRAHNSFNGVSVVGPLDANATILVNNGGTLAEEPFAVENSSLASQAVGPPLSVDEMSFIDRPFPAIGKKLVNRQPLRFQLVHPRDSVLGRLARTRVIRGKVIGPRGLTTTYARLIKKAFAPRYWESQTPITFNAAGTRNIGGASRNPNEVFTQMEANFSLFFGLSVQAYQATLVSEQSPFDKFMAGDDAALSPQQLQGLLVFLNRELRPADPGEPDGNNPEVRAAIAAVETANPGLVIGAGNCVSCHGGAEFTDASVASAGEEPIEIEETPALQGGLLVLPDTEVPGLIDNGFSNIGVRPTSEDLGRGGEELGFPLSFTRQFQAGLPFAPEPECDGPDLPPCPDKVQVDGAMKIPGLRNVELTGPYFHNGGHSTLAQVVEFYDRQSDFGDMNIDNMDRNMVFIDLDEADEPALIDFLIGLTDNRVRNKLAPFDHPQLFVPDGHPGDQNRVKRGFLSQARDAFVEIPAVGKRGLPAAGLPPVGTFLDLDPFE